MKVETKKIDPTKREIYIEADSESVKKKFEDVFERINKEAKIPGFRAGHIPLNILEKHYANEANQKVLEELIPEFYQKAIEKENLEVVDYPDIYDIKLDRNNLSFKAKVEVLPEINLKNYRRIKLNYKKVEVSQDEVNAHIDSLLKQRKIAKLDVDFAHSLGYPNIDEMRSSIEKQLFIQKENQNYQQMENCILEHLLKEIDFKVPQSLVKRKLDYLLRQLKLELVLKGLSKEEIEAKETQLENELKPQAEKQARLEVIFTQIAKKENIPQDENMFQRVLEFLFREADWQEAR
jgi:FKBP-type peptidyl-prolyl cis-trans isomerase (trigger factor)